MPVRKETSGVRREQIVKAALAIIGAKGVQGLTTARIAKAVGISEANIYRHFRNKDDVVMAVIDSIETTLTDNLKAVCEEDVTSLKKIERIFNLHLAYISDNRGIPRVVFSSEILFTKDIRKKLSSFVDRYLEMLAGILEEGTKDGSIKRGINARAMASLFIGMIQLNALRWLLDNFRSPLTKEGGRLWQTYRKSVEAGPQPPA